MGDWFSNELSWDGVIAIIGIGLGVIATVASFAWRAWRKRHPIRIKFALDSYDLIVPHQRSKTFAPRWETTKGTRQCLLSVTPHTPFHLRRMRARFVERKWFTQKSLWAWVPTDINRICFDNIVDPHCCTHPAPLYFFDAMPGPGENRWEGDYANDHDYSRGIDIARGQSIWYGLTVVAQDAWKGRLELEMHVNGEPIFERKRFHVVREAKPIMAKFRILSGQPDHPASAKDSEVPD